MLCSYWQKASTLSPGCQLAPTWMGAFRVNVEISLGRYLSYLLTHQFFPVPLFHLLLPFKLCSDSLKKFATNASKARGVQPSRALVDSGQWEQAPLLSLENLRSPICPLLPQTCDLKALGNWKSYLFTPCRKYNIDYWFGGNVKWNEVASSGGYIWK